MIAATTNTALSQSKLTAALEHAAAGRRVLPCWAPTRAGGCSCGQPDCGSPGKHPIGQLVPNGLHDATTDAATIRRWWSQYPLANPAWATGSIVVLDIDPRHGGDETLAELERQYGPLPETPEAITGSGGRHILFAAPDGGLRNGTDVAPGLDIRGDGGYVIGAGSSHVSGGRYEWNLDRHPGDMPLAPIPNWLLAKIRQAARGSSAAQASLSVPQALSGAPEGQRDDALFKLVCKLHRAGIPEDWALRLVAEAAQNCTPPFSIAKAQEKVTRIYAAEEVDPLGGAESGDPVDILQRRVVALEEELALLKERDRRRRQIIQNPHIEAATKIVGIELIERADYLASRTPAADGDAAASGAWIANTSLAKATGLSPKCVGRHVKAIADTFGVISRTLEKRSTTEGPNRVETRQLITLPDGGVGQAAAVLAAAANPDTTERRRHGGRREWCELHPDAAVRVTETSRRVCTECGEVLHEEQTERTVMRRAFRLEGVFAEDQDPGGAFDLLTTQDGQSETEDDTNGAPVTTHLGQSETRWSIATQDGQSGIEDNTTEVPGRLAAIYDRAKGDLAPPPDDLPANAGWTGARLRGTPSTETAPADGGRGADLGAHQPALDASP